MKKTTVRIIPAPTACTTDSVTTTDVGTTMRPPVDSVSRRAREIWDARGRPVGCDDEIWYEAERQIAAEMQAGTPPLAQRGDLPPVETRGGATASDVSGLSERVDNLIAHHSPPDRRPNTNSIP